MWQHKLAGKKGNDGFLAFIKDKKWVYQKQSFFALKGCHEAGTTCVRPR